MKFDGIAVDLEKIEVVRNGTPVVLSAHEFRTLQFFLFESRTPHHTGGAIERGLRLSKRIHNPFHRQSHHEASAEVRERSERSDSFSDSPRSRVQVRVLSVAIAGNVKNPNIFLDCRLHDPVRRKSRNPCLRDRCDTLDSKIRLRGVTR